MPRLRTDDGPRKLRAVWLGPAGSTLPFQWTYVQWLVTLVAIPIGAALCGLPIWLLGAGLVWTLSIGVVWGGAAGVWLALRLMRHVTYDEPLRYQWRLVRGEFSRAFSTAEEQQPIQVSFSVPPIGYLSPAVCRAMGWDAAEQLPLGRGHGRPAMTPANAQPVTSPAGRPATRPAGQKTNPYLVKRVNPYLTSPPASAGASSGTARSAPPGK
jgi:hypothetical protein